MVDTRPALRGERAPSTLIVTIVALALTSPSALAQLPQLPLKDGAAQDVLPGSVVENVVSEPLPAPVEDVVAESPVAPIREELRRVVGEVDSGTTGGEPAGAGPAGASTTGPAQPRPAGAAPGTGGNSSTGRTGTRKRRTGLPDSSAPRSPDATGGAGARPAASGGSRHRGSERGARKAPQGDAQNPVVRTIEKIVEVVPTLVWIALGVLLALATGLGARAFVERRRARELEQDRERLIRDVGALERALLPAVPERLGALATSVAHRASEGPAAGGDFYDVFELGEGRVAVVVGDVSGHGPDALERTNSLRATLHERLEEGLSPRGALESVGRSARIGSSGQFATVVVAVHDPRDGTLTYATAGHPPPILAGRGAQEPITIASSPPIGVGLRTGLRETRVPLPPETVACLFTDGLLEARVSDDLIGREGLTRLVAELGPEQYADSLLAQVIAVADEAPDDMAVCVLRAVDAGETFAPRAETLVLDAEDIALGLAGRFLEACEVPAYQTETALEALPDAVAASGEAVLEVTVDDSAPHVRVTRTDAAYRPATL